MPESKDNNLPLSHREMLVIDQDYERAARSSPLEACF